MPSSDRGDLPPTPPGKRGWPWEAERPLLADRMSDGREWPRISIVTPSLNQGAFLEETIRSVLLQGYPNLEYIVMDGGSADNSRDLMRQYAPWLAYWTSEADAGQAEALGRGFQRASGEILAWLNADDFYEPEALRRIAAFFSAHPAVVFANGDVNIVDADGAYQRRVYAMRPSRFFAANSGQHGWPQPGCFWRRAVYEQAGGIDPALQFCMDKDLFIRLVGTGPGRRVPGPPLANFRQHPAAKSARLHDVAQRETAALIAKYGREKWTSHPRLLTGMWWLFRKQAALRMRLTRYLGLEY